MNRRLMTRMPDAGRGRLARDCWRVSVAGDARWRSCSAPRLLLLPLLLLLLLIERSVCKPVCLHLNCLIA